MKIIKAVLIFLILAVPGSFNLYAEDSLSQRKVGEYFRGLDSYKINIPYSKKISEMYLGLQNDGEVKKGLAVQEVKIYEKVTFILLIENTEDRYIVKIVDIPDIKNIKDEKKQKKLLTVAEMFTGFVIKEKDKDFTAVDAVSGASRFNKQAYLTLNNLAEKTVSEMESNPSWKKNKLQ